MSLVYLSCAWVAGVYLGSRLDMSPGLALALAGLFVAMAAVARGQPKLALAFLCAALLFAGAGRYAWTVAPQDSSALAFYNGAGGATMVGTVVAEPDRRDRVTLLRVGMRQIEVGGVRKQVSGTALVTVRPFPSYQYGDAVSITGEPETPSSEGAFDYREYLARQGIGTSIAYPEVRLLESGKGVPARAWLLSLKERLSRPLESALPEPQASLAKGILLGTRSAIPSDLNEAFIRTGTSHILAISGYNIAIIIAAVSGLGLWLMSRRWTLGLTLAAIAAYTVLTGAEPPVLRAAIMGTMVVIAGALGRQTSAINSLAFAAALMVGLAPRVLWSISFQLSFLSVLGLIWLGPSMGDWSRRAVARVSGRQEAIAERSPAGALIEATAITMAAIVSTLPIVLFYFQRLSLVAPVANLFAVPSLPPAMLASGAVSILGLVSAHMAQAAGWLAWLPLTYMEGAVRLFGNIPQASVDVGGFGGWTVAAYYALLLILWKGRRWRGSLKTIRVSVSAVDNAWRRIPARWLLLPLMALAVIVWGAAFAPADTRYRVSFLDVGQGDSILVRTPRGRTVLVDGGPSRQAIGKALGKRLPFYDRSIDLVVATHPEQDHIGGLIDVVRRYRVGKVMELHEEGTSAMYREWRQALEERKVERIAAQVGQRVALADGVSLEVLHPPPSGEWGELTGNDLSLVLRLTVGRASFLLTGDIGEKAEQYLLANDADVASDVLKVGHHGSRTSTSEAFLKAVGPRLAVISVGADNTFGHPAPETLQKLSVLPVLRTDQHGAVEFATDGRRLWLRTEKRP